MLVLLNINFEGSNEVFVVKKYMCKELYYGAMKNELSLPKYCIRLPTLGKQVIFASTLAYTS